MPRYPGRQNRHRKLKLINRRKAICKLVEHSGLVAPDSLRFHWLPSSSKRVSKVSHAGMLYVLVALVALGPLSLVTPTSAGATLLHHYEYVFPDSSIYVYDMDNRGALVKHVNVPTSAGVRGTVASAASGMLYISFGSDR